MAMVDKVYRWAYPFKLFAMGWGSLDCLMEIKRLKDTIVRDGGLDALTSSCGLSEVHLSTNYCGRHSELLTGHFESPAHRFVPLTPELSKVRFQIVKTNLPLESCRGLAIILPATGDHGFVLRRRLIARQLSRWHGVTSIIPEIPFYGHRKPSNQCRSALLRVSDLYLMGLMLILECNQLFRWSLETELIRPDARLVICGSSLGSFLASLVTAVHPPTLPPVSSVLAMSGVTASSVFTEGVMSRSVSWPTLRSQLNSVLAFLEDDYDNVDSVLLTKKPTDFEDFTTYIFDYFTHLGNWPTPLNPELVSLVEASEDQYIPKRIGHSEVTKLWRGSRINLVIDGGHVNGTVQAYRHVLVDQISKAVNKKQVMTEAVQ